MTFCSKCGREYDPHKSEASLFVQSAEESTTRINQRRRNRKGIVANNVKTKIKQTKNKLCLAKEA